MRNNFEDKIGRKIYDHATPPPEGLWASIEQSLPPVQIKPVRVPLWQRRWVAAASFMLLFSSSFLIYELTKNENNPPVALGDEPQVTKQIEQISTRVKELEGSAQLAAARVVGLSTISQKVESLLASNPISTAVVSSIKDELSAQEEIVNSEASSDQSSLEDAIREFEALGKANTIFEDQILASRGKSRYKNDSSRSLAFELKNGASSSERMNDGFATLRSSHNNEHIRIASALVDPRSGESETKITHHMPLSVGMKLQKSLTDRLSIESGVVYTYMKSDLKNRTQNREEEQHLHYIGIPLSINYSIFKSGRFDFYAKGGAQVDFNVAGKWSERMKYDADYGNGTIESFSRELEKRPQFSLAISAGVSLDVWDKFELYAEPSIAHYFDNNSRIVNVRKERPTDFALQLGGRFAF
ncbi:MAG: outer membrane beta-barrel protein [Bacteroidales bacterium]